MKKLLKDNRVILRYYKKMYGRPLYLSMYGSLKLVYFLRTMGDTFEIITIGGSKKMVFYENGDVHHR